MNKKIKLIPTNKLQQYQGGGYLQGQTVYIPNEVVQRVSPLPIDNSWYQFAQAPAKTTAPAIDTDMLAKIKGHSNYVNNVHDRLQTAQAKIAKYMSENPYAPVPSHLIKETQIDMKQINEGERDLEYTKESLKTAESKKNLNEYVFIPDKGGFLATNLENGKDEFISPDTLASNKNLYKPLSYSDLYARRDSEEQYVNNRDASTWLQFGKGRELVISDIDSAFKQLGESGSEIEKQNYQEFTSPQGQAELMKFGTGNKNTSNHAQVQAAMESVFLRLGNDAKAQLQSQAYTELMQTTNLTGEALHKAVQDKVYQTIAQTAAGKKSSFTGSKSTVDYDAGFSTARKAGAGNQEDDKFDFMFAAYTGNPSLDWKAIPTMYDKDTGAQIGGFQTGVPAGSEFEELMQKTLMTNGVDGKKEFKRLSDLSNVSIRAVNGRELNMPGSKLINTEKMRLVSSGNNLRRIAVDPKLEQKVLADVAEYKEKAMSAKYTKEEREQFTKIAQLLPQTIEYKIYADVNVIGDESAFANNPALYLKNKETNRAEGGVSTGTLGVFDTRIDKETENAFGLKRDSSYDSKLEDIVGDTPMGFNRAVTMPVMIEIQNPSYSDPTVRQTYHNKLEEAKLYLQKIQQAKMSTNGNPLFNY